ncbi:hypothetical protein NLG97_g7988 [Lecanicillium saksenae]|uniref:Uncharacterized protein n=1 Tax=Lecanicillium saksenae TaxID=468837 RepID=A0ACC1QKA8_9HYPO|nr:hypothetical protein NLG97_g7988 [Lecanicillium saksenae]
MPHHIPSLWVRMGIHGQEKYEALVRQQEAAAESIRAEIRQARLKARHESFRRGEPYHYAAYANYDLGDEEAESTEIERLRQEAMRLRQELMEFRNGDHTPDDKEQDHSDEDPDRRLDDNVTPLQKRNKGNTELGSEVAGSIAPGSSVVNSGEDHSGSDVNFDGDDSSAQASHLISAVNAISLGDCDKDEIGGTADETGHGTGNEAFSVEGLSHGLESWNSKKSAAAKKRPHDHSDDDR